MENAHLRMGKLKFVRQTRDTITEVSLHMDRLVGERPAEPRSAVQIHLVSVFGGDQEVGDRAGGQDRDALVRRPRVESIWLLELPRLHAPHAHIAEDREQPQGTKAERRRCS